MKAPAGTIMDLEKEAGTLACNKGLGYRGGREQRD